MLFHWKNIVLINRILSAIN